MIIATFGPSTGWHGKTISYEDGQFLLEGHGPISAADVLSYDGQGQISWAAAGQREWVQQVAAAGMTAAVAAVTTLSGPLQAQGPQQRNNRRWYVRWWAIAAYVVVALIVVAAVAGNHKTTPQAPTQPAAAATPAASATTAPATPTTTAPAAKTYSDGIYLVGTDMPAGNYKGSVSGGSGYWQVSSDANGNNIVANDNPTGAFYVQVRSGQYLTLQGATVAKAASTPTAAAPSSQTYSDGTYLVGTDIPAGNYKGSVSGGDGYWQVSKDANGNNIIANGNPAGSFYVQIKKGQYLKISGVEISRATTAGSSPTAKTVSDGTYLVGTDIPAGRYKGSVDGGSGYWQVSRDANGSNIVANDNPTGSFYVQVKNGQYLTLSGATIKRVN